MNTTEKKLEAWLINAKEDLPTDEEYATWSDEEKDQFKNWLEGRLDALVSIRKELEDQLPAWDRFRLGYMSPIERRNYLMGIALVVFTFVAGCVVAYLTR